VIHQTFQTTATLTAVDQAKRQATLLAPDGKDYIVKVGPKVGNFDQLRVGDQISASVTQTIVVSPGKAGANSADGKAGVDQQGGVVADTTQVTARVIATDLQKRTATLSLSHIAVPISPADPVYGTSEATVKSGLPLGSLSMRGEHGALLISDSLLIRQRHNPFYQFMEDHVVQWLAENSKPH
jgi:translation elongation factor P/translation initiation factor 5A